VTNLNDSGAGSLRAALTLTYPRKIVFSVSGTINLLSKLSVESANGRLTIDGSTAPNGGICTKGFGWVVSAEDVIIRHVRMRPGAESDPDLGNNDALFLNFLCNRVVIDHCSLSWATDEVLSIYGHNITISNCIISEALDEAGHPETHHSMGCFWSSQYANNVSFHHNFLVHNNDRNPVAAAGHADIINNVLYNGGTPALAVPQDGVTTVNFVKNWQKSGVDTAYGANDANLRLSGWGDDYAHAYVLGNIGPRRATDDLAQNLVVYESEQSLIVGSRYAYTGSHPVTETSATDAKAAVLAGAGATLPKRDAVDARVVADVDAGTGAIIDSPNDVGGYPDLTV
jgi:pectate lyase